MEEDFLAALAAVAAVTAAVGGADDPRMGWGKRPKGEACPAIALHNVSGPRTNTLEAQDSLVRYLVQVECWGNTFDEAVLLARLVDTALQGAGFNTAPLQGCFIENAADDDEPAEGPDAASGSDTLFRSRLDVRVCHQTP